MKYHKNGLCYIPFKTKRNKHNRYNIITFTGQLNNKLTDIKNNTLYNWHNKLGYILNKALIKILLSNNIKITSKKINEYKS